jgi:hypothetical protein
VIYKLYGETGAVLFKNAVRSSNTEIWGEDASRANFKMQKYRELLDGRR